MTTHTSSASRRFSSSTAEELFGVSFPPTDGIRKNTQERTGGWTRGWPSLTFHPPNIKFFRNPRNPPNNKNRIIGEENK